jgi:hypothetical protein
MREHRRMAVTLTYELDVPPGRLDEVHDTFTRDYLPDARARGMHYTGATITPPVVLDDAPTTLVLTFTLDDAAAVWTMKRAVTGNDEVAAFWRTIDEIVVSRRRRFALPFASDATDGRR